MKKILFSCIAFLCISHVFATTYYSQATGTYNTLSNWNSNRLGGGTTPANFTTNGDVFVVQGTGNGGTSPHTMTVTGAALTFGANVKVQVENGGNMICTNSITMNASGTLQIDAGGTFTWNNTGGFANPFSGTESFAPTSNFVILNCSTTGPSTASFSGSLGNVTYSAAVTMQCGAVCPNIAGTLTLNGTSASIFRLTGSAAGNTSLTIGGDLIINNAAASLEFGNGSINGYALNLQGNFNMSAGTILFAGTGGTSGTPVYDSLNFSKNGTQTFTKTGGLITAASSSFRHLVFTVKSGSILDMSANVLNCAGSSNIDFIVNSGAGVILGDPGGIVAQGTSATTGNVQTSSTSIRSFSTGADYTYNGTTTQITGTGLPATVHNLTINNTGGTTGVTLTATTTVSNLLTFNNGLLTTHGTGSNPIVIAATGSVSGAGAGKYVNGQLQKYIPSGTSSMTFEVGDASNYAPTTIAFTGTISVSTGSITDSTASGDHAQIGSSGLSTTNSVNRTWTLVNNSPLTGMTSYSPTFTFNPGTPVDLDASTNTANLLVGRYVPSTWTLETVGTRTGTSTQATGVTAWGDFQLAEVAVAGVITGTITGSPFCAGASVSVPFTITGTFTGGNVFSAQLSDASGSFAAPAALGGALTQTTAGTISGTIPANTPTGSGYRIRVVATSPVASGTDNGVNITINALPTITLGANPSICFSAGAQNVNLTYSATTGSPTNYSISGWSGGGFATVTNASLPASPIVIAVPAGTAAGTYTANLTVATAGGCVSNSAYPISVTVTNPPTLSTAAQAATVCSGTTATINLTGLISGSTGNTIYYHTPTISGGVASGINATGTNASFTLTLTSTNNSETLTIDSIVNGCTSSFAVTCTLSVNPLPAAPTSPVNGSHCGTGTVNLSIGNPGAGLTVDWYAAATGGTVLAGGSGTLAYTTPSNTTTKTYYAETRNTTTGCVSATRTADTAYIYAIPTITIGAAPSIIQGTTTANQPYSAATGTPTLYSVVYAAGSGLTNVTNAAISNPIVLTVPGAQPVGTYIDTFYVTNAVGCTSIAYPSTLTVTAPVAYYSQGSLDATLLSSWNTVRGGGGTAPASFTAGDTFIIQNGHSMTTSATWTVSGTGNMIKIENGGTLTATFIVATANFQINAGGTYVHNASSNTTGAASDIPGSVTRTFTTGLDGQANNGTVEIQKWGDGTGTPAALPAITWGNLKINITTAMSAAWQQSGAITNIKGDFSFISCGISGTQREFRFNKDVPSTLTTRIGGNLICSGVTGALLTFISGTCTGTLNVIGNTTISGGTFTVGSGVATQTFTIGGSLTVNGSGIFSPSGSSSSLVNITVGTDLSVSGGSVTQTTAAAVSYTVNGNFNVSSGSFSLSGTSTSNLTMTVGGSLNISSTGALSSTSSGNWAITVTGDVNLSGTGLLQAQNSSSAGHTYTLNVGGNMLLTGGTFTGGSTAVIFNVNFTGGTASVNYNQSGATFTTSKPTNFTITNGKTVTLLSNLTVLAGTLIGTATVNSGGILNCSTFSVTGAGIFALASGGTVMTANTNGLRGAANNGSIQTTGANTYNSGAYLIYNSTVAAQSTGLKNVGFSTSGTIARITINNTNGTPNVSLDTTFNITDSLKFTAGKLLLGTNNLTMSGTASVISGPPSLGSTTSNYIVTDNTGLLVIQSIGSGGRTGNVVFPVGTTTTYSPVQINNAGTSDNDSVRVNNSFPAGLNSNYVVNNDWYIAETTPGGSNATVSLQWATATEASGFSRANCAVVTTDGTNINNTPSYGAASGANPWYKATISGMTDVTSPYWGCATKAPTITTSVTSLTSFGGVVFGNNSATQTYTVSGVDLQADITITPPADFQVSPDGGTTWYTNSSPLTLTQTGGVVSLTTITVRYSPASGTGSTYSGPSITNASLNAATKPVYVWGVALDNQPTTNATSVSFGTVTINSIVVNWTRGNGDSVIVIAKVAGGAGSGNQPIDSVIYNPSAVYGSGTLVAAGNYVVYTGTGTSVTVTGLNANTNYTFYVYEFNVNTSNSHNYLTTSVSNNNIYTLDGTLATDYFKTNSSGNWATAGTWLSSHNNITWLTATLAPTSAATAVTVQAGHIVTVNTAVSTSTTQVTGEIDMTTSAGFTVAASKVVTVSGVFVNAVVGTGISLGAGASFSFTGNSIYNLTAAANTSTAVAQIPTATWSATSTCKITGLAAPSGDYTGLNGVSQTFGNFYISCPNLAGNLVLTNNGGSMAVADTMTIDTTGTGSVQLCSSSAQKTVGVGAYIQNSGTVMIVAHTSNNSVRTFNVTNNFVLNNTSIFNVVEANGGNNGNIGILNVSGNLTMAPGATLLKSSTGASVTSLGYLNFAGASAQTAVFGIVSNTNASGSAGIFNIAVTGAGGVTLNSNLTVPDTLSLAGGNMTVSTSDSLIFPAAGVLGISLTRNLNINGIVLNQGTFTTPGSWSAATNGTWTLNNGATYIHYTTGGISGPLTTATLNNSSNFIYRGSVSPALVPAISIAGKTYGNLTFESVNGLTTMTSNSGAAALTVNGNLSIGGVLGLGTVAYSISGYTGAVNVVGNVGIVSGSTFTDGTSNISLAGNWNNAGTFVAGTGKVTFNSATGGQSYTQTGTGNFYDLTIANTLPGTVTMNNSLTTTDTLRFSSGVLNINGNTLTATGIIAAVSTSTITGSATSNLVLGGTAGGNMGTFYFTSTGTALLNNLTLDRAGTTPSAIVGGSTGLAVYGTLSIGSTNSNNTLDLGLNALTAGGGGFTPSISATGTLKTQCTGALPLPVNYTWGGTVVYNSSAAQNMVYGNFNNLDGTGGARTLSSTGVIGVAATLTAGSGPYTVTGSSVNFNGSGAQTIPVLPTSTAAPYVNQYNILTASGGNTKTVAGAFTLLDSLKIASSTTLAMGTNTLTLKSTQTQTARVAKIDGTLNQGTGKFIVERHIPAHRAWRLMTAPIVSGTQTINQAWQEGANTTSANPNPGYGTHITGDNTKNESMGYDISPQLHSSIFAYNTTSGAWDILPATTNGVDATTYPGYMLFVRGSRAINMPTSSPATTPDNAVLRPTAQIKTGSQSAITNGSGGFMTIANPFPSPINFHSLNKSGLVGSDAYYMWDPNLTGSNAVGAFVTFSYNSGTGLYDKSVVTGPGSSLITNTGVIPSGAAIMVNFNAGGSIAVAEKDKCADAGGQPYTFRTMNGQGSLRTTLYAKNNDGTQSVSDGNLITFAASNNNVVDNEDAVKINNFAENFSLAPEGKLISIERRQPVMVNDTIFYKMWKMKQKDYVLELAPDNMADPTLTAYLEDKYTGQRTMVSLTDTSLYPFTINGDAGSIDSSRFRIVFKPAVILPVTITGIHASKQNSAIKVEWNVEQEINMSSYVVERAADGTHFSDMHTTATTGNNSQISFDWLDVHPLAVDNYYRIRCISRSGVITYSPVVKVSFTKGNPAFAIAPNPVKGSTINLQMSNIPDGDYQVQLLNSAGQLVLSRNLHHSGISATMPINAEVPFAAGEYVLHITGPIETNIRVQVTGN